MDCRYVARSFAIIGARSSRHVVAFFLAARSQQRTISQTSNLSPNPHILTRHRSTAELRVVGIETSRTESLADEPSSESNDLAMSSLRTQETNISPCVGLAPSPNVCTSTRKKRSCCTPVHSSCLLYTSPSPRDKRQSRMPSSA